MNVHYSINANNASPTAVLIGLVISLVLILIVGICFGMATKKMNAKKGYEGGFWWGFFLGVMGLIVIAVRPFNMNNPKYAPYRPTNYMD